jgi:hydroxyacylglutathione hydrolase
MHRSLSGLAALPDDTAVCCAHEYTVSNLRFALAVEPRNRALQSYAEACDDRRARGEPTLPSRIGLERAVNPFLRCDEPAVVASARQREPSVHGGAEVLRVLREWKNEFR